MASIKSKGMKKAQRTLRRAEDIAKALKTGEMSEEQYLYEYKLEYNKVQRRLRNLAKTPVFELAVSVAGGPGKKPIEYMQTFETKNLDIRGKALALEEIRGWANNPFLSSKGWSEGTSTYSYKGRNYNYLQAQELALRGLAYIVPRYETLTDKEEQILKDIKPMKPDDYYKLKKTERERISKWKQAAILARYEINKKAEEEGIKFSDVETLLGASTDGLTVQEAKELETLKRKYAREYLNLIKAKHKMINKRMEEQKSVERRSNQYSRIRRKVKSV